MKVAGRGVDEHRCLGPGEIPSLDARGAVARPDRPVEQVVADDDVLRSGEAVLDGSPVGAAEEHGVVQNLSVRRIGDHDADVARLPDAAKDHVVADDAARVIEAGDLKPVRDAARTVDEQVPLGDGVARMIPHQQRGAGEAAGRRDEVSEDVVADDPVGARVDVDAVDVRIPGGRRVLDHGVLDDTVVDAAAGAVGIALDELLPGVDQLHVVHARTLRAGIEDDRVVVEVANREVRYRDPLYVAAGPDAVRRLAVRGDVHPRSFQHDRVAIVGAAADGDVRVGAVDVQRAGQLIRARGDQNRRVRRELTYRRLELRLGRHGDDGAARRRQRRNRGGRANVPAVRRPRCGRRHEERRRHSESIANEHAR